MASTSQDRRGPPDLLGRRRECEALDRVLSEPLAGRSGVIILRGEAGVGKSALLEYLADRVAGWHVAGAVGVEAEMELAYSGLHQICGPVLEHLDRIPGPQRDALATVFGLSAGTAPDRFRVAQHRATQPRRSARQGCTRRLLDADLHQLAAHRAYVRAWWEAYRDDGLIVLGVHTPEFSIEHDIDAVRRAATARAIDYPIALDDDYAIWRAFDNSYWPALLHGQVIVV